MNAAAVFKALASPRIPLCARRRSTSRAACRLGCPAAAKFWPATERCTPPRRTPVGRAHREAWPRFSPLRKCARGCVRNSHGTAAGLEPALICWKQPQIRRRPGTRLARLHPARPLFVRRNRPRAGRAARRRRASRARFLRRTPWGSAATRPADSLLVSPRCSSPPAPKHDGPRIVRPAARAVDGGGAPDARLQAATCSAPRSSTWASSSSSPMCCPNARPRRIAAAARRLSPRASTADIGARLLAKLKESPGRLGVQQTTLQQIFQRYPAPAYENAAPMIAKS